MSKSLKVGIGFGSTSAVITTLGLMVGLAAGTGSKIIVITGILTIAIADSLSDALGIHVAKEAEGNFTVKEVWQATFFTFLAKVVIAVSFLVPIILFPVATAVYIALAWGVLILIIQSFRLAKDKRVEILPIVFEHLTIAIAVVVATFYVGRWLASFNITNII